jgi:hypothetical protein
MEWVAIATLRDQVMGNCDHLESSAETQLCGKDLNQSRQDTCHEEAGKKIDGFTLLELGLLIPTTGKIAGGARSFPLRRAFILQDGTSSSTGFSAWQTKLIVLANCFATHRSSDTAGATTVQTAAKNGHFSLNELEDGEMFQCGKFPRIESGVRCGGAN